MNTNELGKWGFVSAGLFVAFLYTINPLLLSTISRNDRLNDREFFQKKVDVEVNNLVTCYSDAQKKYEYNWSTACKFKYDSELQECLDKNVPKNVCLNQLSFDKDCSLPTLNASSLDNLKEKFQEECNSLFDRRVNSYSSYLKSLGKNSD